MAFHWKVLLWMLAGAATGLLLQRFTEAPPWTGIEGEATESGLLVRSVTGPAERGGVPVGGRLVAVVLGRGSEAQRRVSIRSPQQLRNALEGHRQGEVVWFEPSDASGLLAVTLGMEPGCERARWLAPFRFGADIFLALLKMLIVPLVMSSIVSGVASVGSTRDLGRLGGKTFVYYVSTSLLAILLGQVLVNTIRPGVGAQLGLAPTAIVERQEENFLDILRRMIPTNVVDSMTQNSAMLQVIFFALLLGFFITRAGEPHSTRLKDFFESFFQVMMGMAKGVLALLPFGVFALLAKVVGETGFGVFRPLLQYMATVTLALVLHAFVTLPLLLKLVGRLSPIRWVKAMAPALMTAFSTSSSSMTLPVTLETVEHRGKVSNKITSFTLPLGATINMDGTALYECIGVVFLAQYYGSLPGGHPLSLAQQGTVVLMALLASIGAAGIPSAGLVMMLTILSALNLPLEGAALLLAVDRPLDMIRTMVNVWSDSCGAAIIARTEGETGPLEAGTDP